MIRPLAWRLWLLIAALQLGGCSYLMKPVDDADATWESRHPVLEQIEQFTIKARVSSGGVFGMSGSLVWHQRPDAFDMTVSGPFGVGAVRLDGHAQEVTVRTRKETYVTPDPERYLHDNLGWTFPVEGLPYWVRGLPSPYSDAEISIDEFGRLLTVEQDNWSLEFTEYQQAFGLELPRKFIAINPEVKIKVVIDEWRDIR